ncbi:MAG: electron transfer flavoprotein subunit beta/FixA family protein [Candidatus Dormibacteraeota bacterium]|nr:electron transfer flavoprotein subunit beta/FixA family protein [Candidatus Dormibacteraeota bacterium]
MKIVVTVKQIPDPNGAPRLTADNRIARDGEVVLDPGDEYGIEAALKIKEATGEGEVLLVSMGPAKAADAIRKGLSMGADRAIHVSDEALAGCDAFGTAQVLAAAIRAESPDLVVCGTESTDGSTGMVPPMLAELLGLPQLTFAKQVEVSGGKVMIQRQTENGYDRVEADLPALVTVTAGIGEPRYASLKGIMAARSKEVRKVGLAELGVTRSSAAEEVLDLADAEQRQAGEIFQDDGTAVDRIVALLAKVKAV